MSNPSYGRLASIAQLGERTTEDRAVRCSIHLRGNSSLFFYVFCPGSWKADKCIVNKGGISRGLWRWGIFSSMIDLFLYRGRADCKEGGVLLFLYLIPQIKKLTSLWANWTREVALLWYYYPLYMRIVRYITRVSTRITDINKYGPENIIP